MLLTLTQSSRMLSLQQISPMMKWEHCWRFLQPLENKSVTKESWSSLNFKIMTAPKIAILLLSNSGAYWKSLKFFLHPKIFTSYCWESISILEIFVRSTISSSAPISTSLRIFSLNIKLNTLLKKNSCSKDNLEMLVTLITRKKPKKSTLSTIDSCSRELSNQITQRILKIDLELQ